MFRLHKNCSLTFMIWVLDYYAISLDYLFELVVKNIHSNWHAKTFTNDKKGQYKLHNIDVVKTNQLKIT